VLDITNFLGVSPFGLMMWRLELCRPANDQFSLLTDYDYNIGRQTAITAQSSFCCAKKQQNFLFPFRAPSRGVKNFNFSLFVGFSNGQANVAQRAIDDVKSYEKTKSDNEETAIMETLMRWHRKCPPENQRR
jgi:hypothetical protein